MDDGGLPRMPVAEAYPATTRVGFWMYYARAASGFCNHFYVQTVLVAVLIVAAVMCPVSAYRWWAARHGMCAAVCVGDFCPPCAIAHPAPVGAADAAAFHALRGAPIATPDDADVARGAVAARVAGVAAHVLLAPLAELLAAASAGGRCVCAADAGLPVNATAFDGAAMLAPAVVTAGAAARAKALSSSPAAHATRMPADDLPAFADAYISYLTPAGRVDSAYRRGAVMACLAWCDALLRHAVT